MADVAPGATLTPSFRDFLPAWLARQPWYAGPSSPSVRPVGFLRFEDPAGEVGIETHLVTDSAAIYQVPMTYRGEPMPDGVPGAPAALIAISEHSLLGTRWITTPSRTPSGPANCCASSPQTGSAARLPINAWAPPGAWPPAAVAGTDHGDHDDRIEAGAERRPSRR